MENPTPPISTPINCEKTIDQEKNFNYMKKTYELNFDSNIYLFTLEINTNDKITFKAFTNKDTSYNFYKVDYKYEDLIKKFLLPKENYNNIIKIYTFFDDCFITNKISIIHEKEKKILKLLVKKTEDKNMNESNYDLILNEAKLSDEEIIKFLIQGKDKTKDLLIKLQILTNGLIEERKKSKNYLEKIRVLEKCFQQNDKEVSGIKK